MAERTVLTDHDLASLKAACEALHAARQRLKELTEARVLGLDTGVSLGRAHVNWQDAHEACELAELRLVREIRRLSGSTRV
jgi:hypothetical protein